MFASSTSKKAPPSFNLYSLGVYSLLAGLSLTSACSRSSEKSSDHQAVQAAVSRLQAGTLVREIEEQTFARANTQSVEQASAPLAPVSSPLPPPFQAGAASGGLSVLDPCPWVARPQAQTSENEMSQALAALSECMIQNYAPVRTALRAIEYFKAFQLPASQPPFSSLSDEQIEAFYRQNAVGALADLRLTGEAAKEIEDRRRKKFTDEELDEFLLLVARKEEALKVAESKFFAAMDFRMDLIRTYALRIDRWELLLRLKETASDLGGELTTSKIEPLLARGGMRVPFDLSRLPEGLLHPYGAFSALPSSGMAFSPLDPERENPYDALIQAQANLSGDNLEVQATLNRYKQMRDRDNPPMPDHGALEKNPLAVKVAMLDTGIDFITYPDLGVFLSDGKQGSIASADYADWDNNPWVMAEGGLEHGSATSATVLTILAHAAPQVLENRLFELAMWKTGSSRELLSGGHGSPMTWVVGAPMHQAIIRQIESAETKPKIVSVSMGFSFQKGAQSVGREGVLLKSPWLWVMAAGNSGVDVHESPMSNCFEDVPGSQRPDGRILCVGALHQGMIQDGVANYSNFGDRVDVYAFESYIGLCPSGTSCATPAVSAAAAAIAAQSPSLSPEQIKDVIVEASDLKALPIDYSHDPAAKILAGINGLATIRSVRVFDPPTMLTRALELAAKKASSSN